MKRPRTLLAPLPLLALVATLAAAQAPVTYRVTVTEGDTRRVGVEVDLPADLPDEVTLSLARWTPGLYAVLDETGRITGVGGRLAEGGSLEVGRDGPLRWKVRGKGSRAATVTYTVQIPPSPVDDRHYLHADGALLLGERTFLRVEGAEARPHDVRWVVPEGWKVAAPLAPVESGGHRATDFEALLDAPMLVGRHEERPLGAGPLTVRLVLDRRGNEGLSDLPTLERKLREALVQAEKALAPLPFTDHLLVLVEGGTLRTFHRGAAVVGIARGALETVELPLLVGALEGVVGSAASVHWHPEGLGPRDLREPPRCASLWAWEGVPWWLARLYVVRAGLAPVGTWCGDLTATILAHRNHLLATRVAPAQSSRRAWPTGPDGTGSLDDSISFRIQGRVVAAALDLRLRTASGGGKGLEDLLRAGWKSHGLAAGYSPEALAKAASEVAGQDLSSFFARFVEAPGELPWDDLLPAAGFTLQWHAWHVEDPKVRFEPGSDGRLRVRGLADDDEFWVAGLRNGDIVEEVNQTRVRTPQEIDRIVARLLPGRKLRIDVRRDDRRRSVRLQLKPTVALEVPAEERDGLVVIESVPPGPLAEAGLVAGDVLEKIDNRRITQVDDIAEALLRVRRDRALFTVRRAGRRQRISVNAPPRVTWRATIAEDPKAREKPAAVRAALLGSR